jgi:hypothetical protein
LNFLKKAALQAPLFLWMAPCRLGGPDPAQELLDPHSQAFRLPGEFFGRFQYLMRRCARLVAGLGDAGKIIGDLLRAVRGVLHIASNFLGSGALFLDGTGATR